MILIGLESHRTNRVSGVLSLIGVVGCITGWMVRPTEFLAGYLFAHVFFLGVSLGSLGLLMIHHLTGGSWGYGVRRLLEAAVANLPLLALMFVPILFGLPDLYPWGQRGVIVASQLLQRKQAYLNIPGFTIRTAIEFTIWIVMGRSLLKWSAEQDVTVSVEPTRRMRNLSGPGLVIYPVTMTVAAVDWLMSMEPEWHSTMFGVLICIGQVLSALVFVILLFSASAESRELQPLISQENFHKLGNLLLAFTMVWAYLAFSQLLIIWSGNLPHEISWYRHRVTGGWRSVAVLIAVFHFFVPFFLLLLRPIKKQKRRLALVALCLFLAQLVALWWTIAPSVYPRPFHAGWQPVASLLAVGGIWWTFFIRTLSRKPLLPLNDPRFALVVPV